MEKQLGPKFRKDNCDPEAKVKYVACKQVQEREEIVLPS